MTARTPAPEWPDDSFDDEDEADLKALRDAVIALEGTRTEIAKAIEALRQSDATAHSAMFTLRVVIGWREARYG